MDVRFLKRTPLGLSFFRKTFYAEQLTFRNEHLLQNGGDIICDIFSKLLVVKLRPLEKFDLESVFLLESEMCNCFRVNRFLI